MKLLFLLSVLLVPATAVAAERVVQLADGSRIVGNVVSMQNDSFTIKTHTLGTLTIPASQIVSMTKPGDVLPRHVLHEKAGNKPAASKQRQAVQSIESGIAGNAALMSDILRLQNDPQMKAVLADPQLMKAVKDLDLGKLAKDPRIKALMNNPAVKGIQSGVH